MTRATTFYHGVEAKEYDQKRENQEGWKRENAVVEKELAELTAGATVIDLGAGTGRWLHIYKQRQVSPILIDVSTDMLMEAHKKAESLKCPIQTIAAEIGQMETLPSGDWIVSSRFMNWIPPRHVRKALEMSRQASVQHGLICICFVGNDTSLKQNLATRFKYWKRNYHSLLGKVARPHYYLSSERAVKKMISRAGFTIIRETVIGEEPGHRHVALRLKAA